MLALLKAKFPELDTTVIDPDLATMEEATVLTSPEARIFPTDRQDETAKEATVLTSPETRIVPADCQDEVAKESKRETEGRKDELPKST